MVKKISILYTLMILLPFLLSSCAEKGASKKPMKVENNKVFNKEVNDFTKFWKEFKIAALASNKEKIAELTCFPFIDSYNQVYDSINSLTSRNQKEFLEKYNLIFTNEVLAAIKSDSYRGYDSTLYTDAIGLHDILLVAKSNDRSKDLVFKFNNGNYCLSYIAYYP